MTGLVIGSIAPDFEYFFRMQVSSYYSHTWTGLLWFDLPLTIILAFVFHLLVRNSLIDNLPNFLAQRLVVFKNFNWIRHFKENLLVVIASVLFGIATHIFWDNFTHKHGQFVQIIDGLKNTFTVAGHSIVVYQLLQHLSTIIGGLIVIYVLFRIPTDKNFYRGKNILRFWFFVSLITLANLTGRLLTGLDYRQYGNVIVTIIAGGLLGLLLAPMILRKKIGQ